VFSGRFHAAGQGRISRWKVCPAIWRH
jgi:hypothetical protein